MNIKINKCYIFFHMSDYSPDDSSLEGVRDRFLRKALRVVCQPFLFSTLLFFFVSL